MPKPRILLPWTLLLATVGLAGIAAADTDPAADDVIDVKPVAAKLRAVTDGKGHYVVVEPFDISSDHIYYGDGKNFWRLRTIGGGAEGDISFDRTFWSPTVEHQAWLQFKDKTWKVACGKRETTLTEVPKADALKMVTTAAFHGPFWRRQAYSLARDDRGRYYYVDRFRDEYGQKGFRLFVGPKGNLKPQRMTNVVNDSKGDIFSTKTGELRLVLSREESTWIQGKKRMTLVNVPVEDNIGLIYVELGVYANQRLGTPCDDL